MKPVSYQVKAIVPDNDLDSFVSTINEMSRPRLPSHYSKTLIEDTSFTLSDTEDISIQTTPYILSTFRNRDKPAIKTSEQLREQSTISNSIALPQSIEQQKCMSSLYTELAPASQFNPREKGRRTNLRLQKNNYTSFLARSAADQVALTLRSDKGPNQERNKRLPNNLCTRTPRTQRAGKIFCWSTPRNFVIQGTGRIKTFAIPASTAIQELAEEGMLTDYWQHKEELEQKYKTLFSALESEEVSEIKCETARLIKEQAKKNAEQVMETIKSIREEYESTKRLLCKQKVLEEEEMLSRYEKMISL